MHLLTLLLLTAALPKDAALTLKHGDARVGTYVSNADGFYTSSYWIEGPTGLVVIDTQFTPSAAEELVTWAQKATGKKVVLAVVLHANPDKFNGTATLQKHGVKVVTSAQVKALIPKVDAIRRRWFYDRWKPDYPEQVPNPEAFGDKSMELKAAGLTLQLHVMGPGCSDAHVAVEWEKHLFVGDLVANGSHSWMELGHTDAWLERLAELKALKPEYVHPGRGDSGGPELLDREEGYLRRVIQLVAESKPHLPVEDAAVAAIQSKVEEAYPGYRFTHFLKIGLPAEYQRQAALAAAAH
jgi:glyoxylase-like metal-dependent hydrolase (beta-lactamase superfamily II)